MWWWWFVLAAFASRGWPRLEWEHLSEWPAARKDAKWGFRDVEVLDGAGGRGLFLAATTPARPVSIQTAQVKTPALCSRFREPSAGLAGFQALETGGFAAQRVPLGTLPVPYFTTAKPPDDP
ncbi:hypothetical protein Micbo1qcDRAFT_174288 [Microdochium bolleyi]|uniref:Uncharacterized protein n=1 Tax=Microdochium bolleyi TaxID=196109 RepID=A0A136J7Q5_9PEZI|nr:hypothetical protein Micbo1qcDRAFT_174288 [Microdochium bolleyi]